jgi:hypothetical protein
MVLRHRLPITVHQQAPPFAGYPQNQPGTDKAFEQRAITWMFVGIAGFVFGFILLTGPLCWYQGSKMRQEQQQCGIIKNGYVEATYWIGVVSTILVLLAVAAVGFIFIAMVIGFSIAS